MTEPNYQEITDKVSDVVHILHYCLKNMQKLNVNQEFIGQISQLNNELIKVANQINHSIKENPEVVSGSRTSPSARKF
jgi:hypothetical protein